MTQCLVIGPSVRNDLMYRLSQPQDFFFFLTGRKETLFFFIRVAERLRFVGLEHQVVILPPGGKNLPENKVNSEEGKAER